MSPWPPACRHSSRRPNRFELRNCPEKNLGSVWTKNGCTAHALVADGQFRQPLTALLRNIEVECRVGTRQVLRAVVFRKESLAEGRFRTDLAVESADADFIFAAADAPPFLRRVIFAIHNRRVALRPMLLGHEVNVSLGDRLTGVGHDARHAEK